MPPEHGGYSYEKRIIEDYAEEESISDIIPEPWAGTDLRHSFPFHSRVVTTSTKRRGQCLFMQGFSIITKNNPLQKSTGSTSSTACVDVYTLIECDIATLEVSFPKKQIKGS